MYLSSISINGFRGIKEMKISFHEKLNVIIGPNASCKTSLIDAIRLFYGWGDYSINQEITPEDFYRIVQKDENGEDEELCSNNIVIEYNFTNLSENQKGAFYQYLVKEDDCMLARVTIEYHKDEHNRITHSYYTGLRSAEQKADYETFQLFKSYYLGALRDSTKDLMSTKNNLLGKVIKRKIDKNNSEEQVKNIIREANEKLLEQDEVKETNDGINQNLASIRHRQDQKISLNITQNKVEYIVNVIKPYIPISENSNISGYRLWENSLGYNNLIYIATVLSDIRDCHEDDPNSIYALLIEEPESHLHPQLQINLYDFLKNADDNSNSQTFITTHSPTLTSHIPLENLILLKDKAYCINDCFTKRDKEGIVSNVNDNTVINEKDTELYKKMIMRYIDVTRSQLFFSKGVLFVEGISEGLLLNTFSKIINKTLTENEIELVMTGTAFYQFLMLFNSSDDKKKLPIKASVITDADQYTDSKNSKYNLNELIVNNYELLNTLRYNIKNSDVCTRVKNLRSFQNNSPNIMISDGEKTLEFQIANSNVYTNKTEIQKNSLYIYLKENYSDNILKVDAYLNSIAGANLQEDERFNTALLLWKCMPGKSDFAQNFSFYLENKLEKNECVFSVPQYIIDAIEFVIK